MSSPKRLMRRAQATPESRGVISPGKIVEMSGIRQQEDVQEKLLLQISEHILLAAKPAEMMAEIVSCMARHLHVTRCFFARIDAKSDRFSIEDDYHENGQPSIRGSYAMSAFGRRAVDETLAGRLMAIGDVTADARTAGHEQSYAMLGIRACVVVPLLREGHAEAAMVIATSGVHEWSSDEISLLATVAERTWLALEKLRLDGELRDREAQFRTLAGLMPVFIFTATPEGEPDFVNESFYRYAGLAAKQSRRVRWEELLHPEDREAFLSHWRQSLGARTVFQRDFRMRGADGTYRWFHGTAHPVRDGPQGAMRWFGSCTDIDDLMRTRTALAAANEQLEERVAQRTAQLADAGRRLEREFEERQRLESEMTELGEEERKTLGQDLHDGVCQHLTGVAMMADSMGDSFQRKALTDEAKRLKAIAGLIRKAAQHAGAVARSLHPVDVDAKTLVRALQEFAGRQSASGQVQCRLQCAQAFPVGENDMAMHLYRIAQEATLNAIKHSGARDITISLNEREEQISLAVTDDGIPQPGHEQASGLSLRVIRCHANAIRGTLTIDSRVEKGTVVKCTVSNPH